jgi:hypothetical protein
MTNTSLEHEDMEKCIEAQLEDGQLVAVKKLHPTEQEMNDERRFSHEMEILVQIRR